MYSQECPSFFRGNSKTKTSDSLTSSAFFSLPQEPRNKPSKRGQKFLSLQSIVAKLPNFYCRCLSSVKTCLQFSSTAGGDKSSMAESATKKQRLAPATTAGGLSLVAAIICLHFSLCTGILELSSLPVSP